MHAWLSPPVFALGLPHGSEWVLLFPLLLFFLIFSVLWIAALVSCIQNESSDGTKLVWTLVILFSHFIGALIYLLIRRPQRIRELGR